jgi:23S rRNA pseudouridine1911/1915/1917 synthase
VPAIFIHFYILANNIHTGITNTYMITVLHEEKDFIIIAKPAGLITHADGKAKTRHTTSVCEEVLKLYPDIKGVGEPGEGVERSGIVHRLDADTSGVMIIARNQEFFELIKQQFQDHIIEKEYKAFVWGWLKDTDKRGVINSPIGRSGSDFRKFVTGRFARGELREAITFYETLAQFEADENVDPQLPRFSYMSLKPKTGRTHQIRVHMKHIHHGIVGDPLYMENHPKALGFTHQALHAENIRFFDRAGVQRHFSAPFPADFTEVLQKYSL